jgi:hypothetical protein
MQETLRRYEYAEQAGLSPGTVEGDLTTKTRMIESSFIIERQFVDWHEFAYDQQMLERSVCHDYGRMLATCVLDGISPKTIRAAFLHYN